MPLSHVLQIAQAEILPGNSSFSSTQPQVSKLNKLQEHSLIESTQNFHIRYYKNRITPGMFDLCLWLYLNYMGLMAIDLLSKLTGIHRVSSI